MPSRKKSALTNIKILCLTKNEVTKAAGLAASQKLFLQGAGFTGASGQLAPFVDGDGKFAGHVFGLGGGKKYLPLITGLASAKLPEGLYELEGKFENPTLAALGFCLGAYRFERYKRSKGTVELAPVDGADMAEVKRLTKGAFIARDLVNRAPNDLGPNEFEKEVRAFAIKRKMKIKAIVGDELLAENFPMIHAVGRASAEAPRLLDLRWGNRQAAKVTLVGKGVTFDSGGLDIKHAAGMVLMKKDMGGAANVLGLAHAIIDAKLNVNLRVLLPIVENAISGSSFRPGDILPSRAGLSVEIGNTDAEGRLVLADALTLADEEKPELIIDMATLTGAARIARGPDLPPLYSDDSDLVRELCAAGEYWGDPLWHMPLWEPYEEKLQSKIADINHISPGFAFAGSVTAALFLKAFVKRAKAYAHLDIFAWAPSGAPGRPAGGTDQGIRAIYQVLKDRYGS